MNGFLFLLLGASLTAQPPEKSAQPPQRSDPAAATTPAPPLRPGGLQAVRQALTDEKKLREIRGEVRKLYPDLLTADGGEFRKILVGEMVQHLAAQRVSNTLELQRAVCRIVLSYRASRPPVRPERIVAEGLLREAEDPNLIEVAERSATLVSGRDVRQPSDRVTVLAATMLMRRALVGHSERIVKQTTPCLPVH